jgi:hypothetical protein
MLNPKLETLNSKQTQMFKAQGSKLYDLENIRFYFDKSKSPFEFCILDLLTLLSKG